ncbi:hypothetical protein SLEP1_g12191 [Rubroshorea leprosula]|uniref:Alpha/beta hydrolase fold-3 domain-containing protein n=1 Tax=Rubroshorea leprosula TaxID=152421 RepID=A0AAV5IHG6_9ROSI|nr:hypothetical protein SLEP1_g12191 [Rubroshorea leprosula]
MDSNSSDIVHEFLPLFRIYKDGRVERLMGTETIPPSTDPHTGVQSKDIIVSTENNLSARLFLPKLRSPHQRLPLLIYIHGGAFSVASPFSPIYHRYLTSLVNEANVIAVSVQYRRAPEHPLPTAYDDTWEAIKWAASHVKGNGPEPWLNDHVDFQRVFLAGDSAGANIAHNSAMKVGVDGLDAVRIHGLVLVHPFFMNNEPDKLIEFIFPSSSGCNDPRMNPVSAGAELAQLGCSKVLVFVAGKDWLKDRGCSYYEALKKSGWSGTAQVVETEGEDHAFHLFNPACEKAKDLMKHVASFLNQE